MSVRWMDCLLGAALALTATSWLSCGQDHKLVAIEIQPAAGFNFGSPNPLAQGDFTAIGTFVHPPGTADITNQVVWKTDIPQLLSIDKGVVSPSGAGCGVADVSASLNSGGNFVVAYSTVTVSDSTNALCPGGSSTLGVVSVSLAGPGAPAGTVTSAPAGIACPGTCIAQFTVGGMIGLNAVPGAGGSVVWAGCTSVSGNTCSILVPKGATNVTATFN
jgi:hypothetical protein